MTSSLVGSEMCIRDSLYDICGFDLVASNDVYCFVPTPTLDVHPLGFIEPVSYTHLTLPTICSV
eukprot:4243158-Prorocentrum_lima.AAC.1